MRALATPLLQRPIERENGATMDLEDDSRMSETSSVRNRGRGRRASSPMGDMEPDARATETPRPQLRCNACWEPILPDPQAAQTCYRTTCSHIFCEKCAYKSFGGGRMVCPACRTDLNHSRGGVCETTIHGVVDPKRAETIWEEMIANPSACFEHFQQALEFVLFQLAQDSYRQEEIRRQMAEEQNAFQMQHGEKYIQLKNYTDQLEAELREIKPKLQTLTTSNEELREAYKEKSRKCRNWEKICKALKSQTNARQYPSPGGSTSSTMIAGESSLMAQSPQFARAITRPVARPYGNNAPSAMMRPQIGSIVRPETPGVVKQRPSGGMFDRFSRHQSSNTGMNRPVVQPIPTNRSRIMRPKTPLQPSQRPSFAPSRPKFHL